MIQLICGAKGSGKTKKIIDQANDNVNEAKGSIVFVTDTHRYSYDIRYQIRVINTEENHISSDDQFIGFLKGILASNHDIESMYIDGAHRILNKTVKEMEYFYNNLESIISNTPVKFILTVSADEDALPDFVKKYI